MAITEHARSAWKTREGGLPATLFRLLKTLVAAAKESGAAISLTAGLRAKDFSPLPLIAFLVFALGRPYRGIFSKTPRSISAARLPISIHPGSAAI